MRHGTQVMLGEDWARLSVSDRCGIPAVMAAVARCERLDRGACDGSDERPRIGPDSHPHDAAASGELEPDSPLTLGTASSPNTTPMPIWFQHPFPEYNLCRPSARLKRPSATRPHVQSGGGFGDIDTSLEWEFLRERRWRPVSDRVGDIRWPSATH